MLQQLRVKNFRLLRDVTIDFDGPVTVLVGPNASGKSTVLEVLDFLSRCAENGIEEAISAHGGFAAMLTAGAAGPLEIQTRWRWTRRDLPDELVLDWKIALVAKGAASTLVREQLIDHGDPVRPRVLVDSDRSGDPVVHLELGDPSEEKIENPRRLAFEQFVDGSRFRTLGILKALVRHVRVLGTLPTSPSWARADVGWRSPRDSVVLGHQRFIERQGLGLANVLYTLMNDHTAAWREIERDFRSEFRFIESIKFPAEVSGSKIAIAVDDSRFPGRKLYASEMSDGMIAYLCLLAAVHSPTHAGALGLDEPDASLHPSAIRRFLAAAQREHPLKRRIVIVTHSNALLDELEDPAASIRIVDSTKDGTIIRKLDPAALDAWRKDYSLSDLRRTGLIDASNGSYGSEATGEE